MTESPIAQRDPVQRPANARPERLRGLHAQTVEVLGARIVSGRYTPGTVLSLDALRTELDISRTVLREALRVLADKGLVDTKQKIGTQVTPRSDWSLLDPDLPRWMGGNPDHRFLDHLGEVRAIMEPAAARLAADRRTDEDLTAMRQALQAMEDAPADDVEAAVEADLAFHRALLDSVHNDLLSRIEVVIEAGLRVRDAVVHAHTTVTGHVSVHRAVLEAIEARDGQAATDAMQALLERARTDVVDAESAGVQS